MPVITYPGVTGVTSLECTCSVGISPASIVMVCYPDSAPDPQGTLEFGNAAGDTITMEDCLVEYQETVIEKARAVTILRLLDRRHRWRYGFPMNGYFNQESQAKKLVPWTTRSPYQLAYILLDAMGELVNPAAQIDLPGGLAFSALAYNPTLDTPIDPAGEYLLLGQNYAPTRTNPPTEWASIPAANALADLAEHYGRIVAFDPVADIVNIVKLGDGAAPPAGFRISNGASVNRDSIPITVTARGAPDRVQIRLKVRAVGKEWDGSWVPLERLSYAPDRTAQTMSVSVGGVYNAAKTYGVEINDIAYSAPVGTGSMTAVAANLTASINAGAVAAVVTASVSGDKLVVTANAVGYEFSIVRTGTATETEWDAECLVGPVTDTRPQENGWQIVYGAPVVITDVLTATVNGTTYTATVGVPGGAATVTDLCTQINAALAGYSAAAGNLTMVVTGDTAGTAITVAATGTTGGATVTEVSSTSFTPKGFEKVAPPFAFAALATTRLNRIEAQRLATESLYRCYQVLCENPADPTDKTIPIPNAAATSNRYTIVLQSTRPEPVVPEPGNVAVKDPRTGQPYAAETYGGYAVDRPNVVYGSMAWYTIARLGLLWTKPEGLNLKHNTPPITDGEPTRLPVAFSIVDPERQVIAFSEAVYRVLGRDAGMTYQPADLVIEVGATILDPETYAPLCYERSAAVVGGIGPAATRVYPDVQREVLGDYDEYHNLLGFDVLDQDAEKRADAYADGWAKTFQTPAGQAIRFDRIVKIGLSGRVRQVTWSISASGLSTTVGDNCEVSRVVLPYPTRRKREAIPANAEKAAQNLASNLTLLGRAVNAAELSAARVKATKS